MMELPHRYSMRGELQIRLPDKGWVTVEEMKVIADGGKSDKERLLDQIAYLKEKL